MNDRQYIAIMAAAIVLSGASVGHAVSRHLSVLHYSPPAGPGPDGPPPPPSGDTPVPEPRTPFEGWVNVFDPARGMASAATPAAPAAAPPAAATYILVGTITSNDPGARRALLWGEGWKGPRADREGQQVGPGTRLASVERGGAWIVRGKARERLDLLPVGTRSRPPATAAPPPSVPTTVPVPGARGAAASPAGPDLRVERISPTSFALDEAGVNQLSGNFNQFMTQVRLVPFFEGNRPSGYRIAGIRPGTTFEKLGFLSGDVLQSVNQIDLNSPEKLYTIFQNLKDERKVGVNVLRGGQKTTLTYEIR
jgi:general secretion pathway protein C